MSLPPDLAVQAKLHPDSMIGISPEELGLPGAKGGAQISMGGYLLHVDRRVATGWFSG